MMLMSVSRIVTIICLTFSLTVMASPLTGPLASVVSGGEATTGIFNPHALDSFFEQLAAFEAHTRQRPLRIMQYGDSHTKAGLFTGAAQMGLQRSIAGRASLGVRDTSYTRDTYKTSTIVYQAIGVNGARLTRLRDMSESVSFMQSVAQNRPDLVVIAYGTNEVTDRNWTLESYADMLAGIITRIRSAAPEASFLILGPPDRSVSGSGGWASVGRISLMLDAQRKAATTAGAAFWSEYNAMGGAGSMNEWVARGLGQSDHVHCTAAGYNRLGMKLAADLIETYRGGSLEYHESLNGLDLRVMRGVPVTSKTAN